MIQSISFIGAGHVATHFAKAFFAAGIQIDSIVNRRLATAKSLAAQVNAVATTSYNKLNKHSDLYIIAVPDDIITDVISQLSNQLDTSAQVIHTSGATSIKLINTHFSNAGVLWPPQSLSKQKDIAFNTVPVCYGATETKMNQALHQLIIKVTPHVQEVSDQQKLALHLAAVFANNFTNHMYSIAYDICLEHNLDFKLLYPIILETSQKIIGEQPHLMQTGPAIRDDQSTIKKHLGLLKSHKEYRALYTSISNSIQQYKSNS